MLWITSLGNWKFVVVLALFVGVVLWIKRKKNLIPPFWATLAGTEITVEVLKLIVHRARPIGASFLETSYSFPSGHAAISVALYGFLAFILMKEMKLKFERNIILTAAVLIILLIGFSRVYLGLHFPTDVLGGYLVGIVWLWIGTHHEEWAKGFIAH